MKLIDIIFAVIIVSVLTVGLFLNFWALNDKFNKQKVEVQNLQTEIQKQINDLNGKIDKTDDTIAEYFIRVDKKLKEGRDAKNTERKDIVTPIERLEDRPSESPE